MKKRPRKPVPARRRRPHGRWRGCLALAVLALVVLVVAAAVLALWLRPDGLREVREHADAWGRALREAIPELPRFPEREPRAAHTEGTVEVWFGPVWPGERDGLDTAFFDLIDSARESCYCALFDVDLDEAARRLALRHQAGVDVRIVTDSQHEGRQALRTCINAGIPVVFDNRSPFMHNKFCVVDGEAVWTGSTNVTFNGFYKNNNNALLIRSRPLAANYGSEFSEMFDRQLFGASSPTGVPHPVVILTDGTTIETLFAPEDDVAAAVVREIDTTGKTIDFMAFSFTSREIADAMNRRAARGAKVRGLFEKRNAASQYSVDERLQEWGAEILLDGNPNSRHHKVIILDRDRVLTGSYNFSANADKRNDENLLVIRSKDLAALYTREFERLARAATRQR
jgi:phosphatidylserine/phosphatidylglycerophosphate/cardiolipin synthase-like enzyme